MATEVKPLPFQEAVDYFRNKVNLPTKAWDDLWQGQHAHAFVIAGAMKDELLCDFRAAIDKAIAKGTTKADFIKDFDAIVAEHGWSYKGGRLWRAEVIYNTNLRTAYQAGRYKQMTDPAVLKRRPYWEYFHGDSIRPRPLHLSWHGTVLPADDPWWGTHYGPNGWGCRCKVRALSPRDMERRGKSGPDPRPTDPDDTSGIDNGWAYNVGEAAWGKPLAKDVMDGWRVLGGKAWERMTPGDWQSNDRPQQIPADAPAAKLGPTLDSKAEAQDALRKLLGGDEKIFTLPDGSRVLVNGEALAGHLPLDRSSFLPLLPSLLDSPSEIWLSFERHKGTGQVVLRKRLVKAVALDKDRFLVMSAQARKGMFEAWTIVPTSKAAYAQGQRYGDLIWSRKDGDLTDAAGRSPGDG